MSRWSALRYDPGMITPRRQRLESLLESFAAQRIAVVGDVALDAFVQGRTSRISREAPVLILRHEDTQERPGCAANAARNVTALGGAARQVGLLGTDDTGRALRALLERGGIDTRGLVEVDRGKTWSKTRFSAGDLNTVLQQVMRLDHEPSFPHPEEWRARLHEAVQDALEGATGVLLCDYGGGVLEEETRRWVLTRARERDLPIVADSRYAVHEFVGVTCATPNETEIEPWAGQGLETQGSVEQAGAALRRRLEAQSLIVTRGKLGMTVFSDAGPAHLAAFGADAVDVAGAGDTVAATVSLALAAGATVDDAARLANYAASRVVLERGTTVTDPDAVRACFAADSSL